MKRLRRSNHSFQHGLTLIEVMVGSLIMAGLVGLIGLVAMNSFKLDSTQRGNDLNHFNFNRLTEAFYNDVHASSALSSATVDGKRIVLQKADGSGFVTYEIGTKAVKRGESATAGSPPQKWEELTDSSMFSIAAGSFAAFKADGSVPASMQDVRRIDLKDLLATLNNNPQSKKLPLLSAYLRSVAAPSPSPSAGPAKVYAVLTANNFTYAGNTGITSTPSGKADVHANGNLTRDGSSNIDGKVTYVGTYTTDRGGHSGGIPTKADPVKVPSYTPAQLQSLANSAKANGNKDIDQANSDLDRTPWQGGKRYATLKGYYSATTAGKKLAFGGVWEVTVEGVVYIEGGLQTNNTFVLKGNGLVICTEPIVTGGNTQMRVGASPSDLGLVSLSTRSDAISTGGTSLITGILFAPNGGIMLSGGTKITGCLLAGGAIDMRSNSVPIVEFNANQSLSVLQATY
ncbi:hypothetical protein D3C86_1172920 [compost metagenome]